MEDAPEFKSEYAADYKRIVVSGIMGAAKPLGIEAVVYSESVDVKKALETHPVSMSRVAIRRVAECELIIDPQQMRSLHIWLGTKISEYETMFGTIPSPEEVRSRRERAKSKER